MPDCLRASVDNGPFLVFLESESEPEYRNRRFKPSSTYISINRGTGGTVCTRRKRFVLASKQRFFSLKDSSRILNRTV